MIHIRPELADDSPSIRAVLEAAFEGTEEADLVDLLRAGGPSELVSLVAEDEGHVVGQILFSKVVARSEGKEIGGMGLAPMAVLPDYQRQGIGSQMVRLGLQILRKQGYPFVVVLGHPEFYPRFGFAPASQLGLKCQWEGVADEVFMAMILNEGPLDGFSGIASYRDEFGQSA